MKKTVKKYLYKKTKKSKKHMKTRKTIDHFKKLTGGEIKMHHMFQYIKSIGFEIETVDLIKFTIEQHNGREILVNSALTNNDLEYGYIDENEYTDIIDEPNLKFKITNDSAEDTDFNKEIQKIASIHQNNSAEDEEEYDEDEYEAEDCDQVIFKLKIPNNNYLKQTEYDILVREPDQNLHFCSSFTDVEWIITYYKPDSSKNIIVEYFLKTMQYLKDHLSQLVTINNSTFNYLNENNEFVNFNYSNINQAYVLPTTSLVYFNNSVYNIPNYDITKDLKFVPQMTFSCDINYVFKIMKTLLSLEYNQQQIQTFKNILNNTNGDSESKEGVNEMINKIVANENFDMNAIDISIKIIDILFKTYNSDTKNSEYSLNGKSIELSKIKMYIFLIIYKIYIYLNSYLEETEKYEANMLKKNLSFAIRHTNYFLYLEIKKLLKQLFASQFTNKDEQTINNQIIQIINNLINDQAILKIIYQFPYVRNKKVQLSKLLKENPQEKDKYYGNPLYSVSQYFTYFENPSNPEDNIDDESKNKDWLVKNDIDEKSTKFELNNDTIIIEFRGFPSFCYLYLFMTSTDQLREKILNNNIGTFNMEIIDEYIGQFTSTGNYKP